MSSRQSKGSEFIDALDYTVNQDHDYIKIDYMIINDDDEHGDLYKDYLDTDTAQDLDRFYTNCSKDPKNEKNTMDVHSDLRIYKKYYKPNGFELTDRKCTNNPFWIETEKYVNIS